MSPRRKRQRLALDCGGDLPRAASSGSMITALPIEVLERVISFLHNKQQLLSLTLTSQQMRHAVESYCEKVALPAILAKHGADSTFLHGIVNHTNPCWRYRVFVAANKIRFREMVWNEQEFGPSPNELVLSPSQERFATVSPCYSSSEDGCVALFDTRTMTHLVRFDQRGLDEMLWLDENHILARGESEIVQWSQDEKNGDWSFTTIFSKEDALLSGFAKGNKEIFFFYRYHESGFFDNTYPIQILSVSLEDGRVDTRFTIDITEHGQSFPFCHCYRGQMFVCDNKWLVIGLWTDQTLLVYVYDIHTNARVHFFEQDGHAHITRATDSSRRFFIKYFSEERDTMVVTVFDLGVDGRLSPSGLSFPVVGDWEYSSNTAASDSHVLSWDGNSNGNACLYNAKTGKLEKTINEKGLGIYAISSNRNEVLTFHDSDNPCEIRDMRVRAFCLMC